MSLQWKQAEACRLSNQYDKAAELYQRVYAKDAGRTYPDVLRWSGEMLLCNGNYDEAEQTWTRVLQKEKDKNSVTAQRARNAIAGCAIAREAMAAPRNIVVEHLPQPVNTYDSEFGARIGPDSALYFTSLRGDLNKEGEVLDTASYLARVFRTIRNNGTWNPALAVTKLSTDGPVANPTWSLDGERTYFTYCPNAGPCRIHHSQFNVMDPSPAPMKGLGDEQSTQPMVVLWEDLELLFFVSDRPGGMGGMDIWQASIVNGEAVDVRPLGPPVNTPGDERSPWYDTRSRTLWFSSDFLPGMGGYDIFTSVLTGKVFGAPVHAGVPLNSPANDLYPALFPARNEGWITSNRVGSFAAKGETCCNDLYRFELPVNDPVAVVRDTVGPEAQAYPTGGMAQMNDILRRLPLKLYFHNDEPDPRSWSTTTTLDYGTTYRSYRALIPEYEQHAELEALRKFFKDDVDRGYLELAELVIALRETLDNGTSVTLDVRGHASPLAPNDYNINLSTRRIESLRNHLRLANGGVLKPYVDGTAANNATIRISVLPFGEDKAGANVSDDITDLDRSVYAVQAALERRIEVEALHLRPIATDVTREVQRKQIGITKQDEPREVVFTVRNSGNGPMRLLDSRAECGCTTADLHQGDIAPGQEVQVTVKFNGRAPLGALERSVTIRTNGVPEKIELIIEGEIVP
jgi:hypothetical protein